MESAIFGLVGVIVGGLITAGSNFVLARRQERASTATESRIHAADLKRAARLIDLELLYAQAAAVRFIEKRRWWSEDLELVTESWQQYRAIVAPELSWDDWHGLATAALAVDQMRALQAMARREGLLYHTITEDLSANMTPILSDIRLGRGAIAPLFED